jgi:hypothetical protein
MNRRSMLSSTTVKWLNRIVTALASRELTTVSVVVFKLLAAFLVWKSGSSMRKHSSPFDSTTGGCSDQTEGKTE